MQTSGLSGSTGKSTKEKAAGKVAAKRTRTSTTAKKTLHLKTKNVEIEMPTSDLTEMIATAAYFCAERRQFEPGHELDDWLVAENQVRAAIVPSVQHSR